MAAAEYHPPTVFMTGLTEHPAVLRMLDKQIVAGAKGGAEP